MKKLLLIILGVFLASTAHAVTVFNSTQVGTNPVNGSVLQTNGTVSTWVTTSSLGIGGGAGSFNATGSPSQVLVFTGTSTGIGDPGFVFAPDDYGTQTLLIGSSTDSKLSAYPTVNTIAANGFNLTVEAGQGYRLASGFSGGNLYLRGGEAKHSGSTPGNVYIYSGRSDPNNLSIPGGAQLDTTLLTADTKFTFPNLAGTFTLGTGFTAGDCIKASNTTTVTDAGAACGGGGLASTTPFTTGNLTIVSSSGALATYAGSLCGGVQFVTGISASGTVTCATPSGGASSTNVFGTNGVTVAQVGVNATASLDTTYSATITGGWTFSNNLYANSSTFTSPSGTVLIGNNQTASLINIVPSTSITASQSVGGAFNLTNTNNSGTGAAFFTNFGAGATGRLLNGVCNNVAFDQECFGILNEASNTSALGIIADNLTSKGVLKVTHNAATNASGTATDANASVFSGDIHGTSTAAQGLFITNSIGWTSGRLLTLRNGTNVAEFAVGPFGDVGLSTESPRARLEIKGMPSASSTATDYIDISSSTQGDILTISSTTFSYLGNGVVVNTRAVNTGGILSGGGNLSADRTISLSTSTLYSEFTASGTGLSFLNGQYTFDKTQYLASSTNLAPSTTIPVTYVSTFNGATGTIIGVNSVNGATGTVTITSSSLGAFNNTNQLINGAGFITTSAIPLFNGTAGNYNLYAGGILSVATGTASTTISLSTTTLNTQVSALGYVTSTGSAGVSSLNGSTGTYNLYATSPLVVTTGTASSTFSCPSCSVGGNPGGADTNIQYNNGGTFGGDSGLTWTSSTAIFQVSGTLQFPMDASATTWTIKTPNQTNANTNGNGIQITPGNASGTGVGGGILIQSGRGGASSSNGGTLTLNGGTGGNSTGTGGSFSITGGQGGNNGNGGTVTIAGGSGGNSGATTNGGLTTIKGGVGRNGGNSGNVLIVGGLGAADGGGSNGGNVILQQGSPDSSGGTTGKISFRTLASTSYDAIMDLSLLSASHTFTWPNKDGTIAMTSDISGGGLSSSTPWTNNTLSFISGTSQLQGIPELSYNTSTGQTRFTSQANINYGNSQSTGGMLTFLGTNTTSSGLVGYSNQAAAVASLFQLTCDTAWGTSDCFTLRNLATGTTALAVISSAAGKGAIKITHNMPTDGSSDANASALSLSLAGTSTNAMGIFLDSASGTQGNLFEIRNKGATEFRISSSGVPTFLGLGSSGNPCIVISSTAGLTATSTCGTGSGIASTTPWTLNYLPLISSTTGQLTNSNLYQTPASSDLTIGSTSDNGLFSVVNTSDTVAFQVASTTNNQYRLQVASGSTQQWGVASSGKMIYEFVTSSLYLADASGFFTAYGGSSNPCAANQAPTTISAVGALGNCTATFLTGTKVDSLGGATGAVTLGMGLTISGQVLSASSTFASSTWGSATILNGTAETNPIKLKSIVKRIITQISCEDDVGTTTFHIYHMTALATTSNAGNITSSTIACGAAGNTTTTFTNTTINAGEYLAVTSTVAGTPNVTNLYIESTKQ